MASDNTPTPMPGLAPDAVPGYRLLRVLGRGGMATVYAAQQEHPRRMVALKVLQPHLASPQMLRRFRKEIDLLAKLSHPCIAQVYAAGVVHDGGRELPYFTMEFVPSAQTILDFSNAHELDQSTRVRLFVNVCAAVEHGHRQRVLHLDLKPGNVLINREGHVKVIDFGVARVIEQPSPDMTTETADQVILGSLHAMSPEQVDPAGRDLDARSDVYSLGVLLYRLLFGMLPYELSATSIVKSARTICETPPRKPRDVDSSVSPELEAVMLRALEKDPALRFRHAGEFGKALRHVESRSHEGTEARRVEHGSNADSGSGASGKVVAIVTGVILIAALVISFMMLQRGGQSNAVPQGDQASRSGSALTTVPGGSFDASGVMQQPFVLVGHSAFVSDLSFDATGIMLASSSHDRTVRVWDLSKRAQTQALTGHEESLIECVAIAADAERVASGARSGTIVIEDAAHGEVMDRRTLPTGPVRFLAFDPSGTLAAASDDLTVRLFNPSGKQIATLRSASGAFITGTFNYDGSRFAAATTGGQVHVWNLPQGSEYARFNVGRDAVHALAFSAEGDVLTVIAEGGIAVRHDIVRDERLQRLAVTGRPPIAMTTNDDGTHLILVRPDNRIEIWDIVSGAQLETNLTANNTASRIAYSSRSKRLAIGSTTGAIEVLFVPLAAAP